MIPRHIALVSESPHVRLDDLLPVSAALQTQVMTDFGPVWGVQATVDVFATLAAVPIGYWPVIIRDQLDIAAHGAHRDQDGRPFALVLFSEPDWPMTVGHEVLEMLADPFCLNFIPGPAVTPGGGTVEYLVEVCDPCQEAKFGYKVNEILLSDFVTPRYYDSPADLGQYSFAGHVTAPREVLRDGYLTWRDPATGVWSQHLQTSAGPVFRALDPADVRPDISLRGSIDRATNRYLKRRRPTRARKPTKKEQAAQSRYAAAAQTQAAHWKQCIDQIVSRYA